MQEQEANLTYVAITRAKENLIEVLVEELKNNEELYKIIDTYIDSGDYDITEKDRARLKRN